MPSLAVTTASARLCSLVFNLARQIRLNHFKITIANMSEKKSLVIVESPAKARTIAKYLGSGFQVEASIGHIRDLPGGAK